MKIGFIGDSITKGTHGVSFVQKIKNECPQHEIVNLGVGGDTIISLYKSVLGFENMDSFDVIFLFVGVNDILSKLSLFYKIVKRLMRQKWSKNVPEFEDYYILNLELLLSSCPKIYVIPPLLIGEDINNKWNKQIGELVTSIDAVLKLYPQVEFVDIRQDFIYYLSGKQISSYIPLKASEMKKDGDELETDKEFDDRSVSRGLHLTIDGVHINTKGATLVADRITKIIKGEIDITI